MAATAPSRLLPNLPVYRAMTRCECAEMSFEEVARRVDGGTPLEEVMAKTGCGATCTACRPDLMEYLARTCDVIPIR